MSFEIRKIVTYSEETRIEGGKATDKPVTMVGGRGDQEPMGRSRFR